MFGGPIIAREVVTTPRSLRYYLWRASFSCVLFVLLWTAWQVIIGWQDVREVGVLARFGGYLYFMFAMLQLTLMLFFAPLFTAAAVSHEKDRRTFNLLLMTSLSDLEIVVGKLVAGLLNILIILAASVGLLSLCALLGGISFVQVLNLFAVTAASGVAGGAMGLLIALWRDRTFQSISLTILMVVFSVTGVELLSVAFPTLQVFGVPLGEVLNPYRAMIAVLYPASNQATGVVRASSLVYIGVRLTFAACIVAFGTYMLRKWNPGHNEPRELGDEAEAEELIEEIAAVEEPAGEPVAIGAASELAEGSSAVGSTRRMAAAGRSPGAGGVNGVLDGSAGPTTGLRVPRRTHRRVAAAAKPYRSPWANPILWRELKTRAYGTKPLIIKGCYALLFALGVGFFLALSRGMANPMASSLALIPVGLTILSLIMVNAQGVTALTSERDSGALDLLLVTELSPGNFIYGKLFGILYNSKEMVALPLLFAGYLWWTGRVSGENLVFFVVDYLLLCHFAAMLGLHSAISFTSSRVAIANSLGTIFFLMTGILICSGLIILSDQAFGRQILSFMIFIGVGSVALFGSLGAKNPSRAIALVSLLTPFWTFYCIISLLHGDFLAAFLFSVGVYGFALTAMLVPAVGDFDIALGRTGAIQG
ncbi:ABC-2 family transporter protein [Aquisphaera giovannonii]|uniref:ABC-2 family transporter protein n=1 Tax=Aquisphaera giovannonii TaxID=406548 RepID=A0A5B9VZI6_9BACT|nr:ABC transporter permease subunit [Aquisphaera giovannonii]QEH33354.1 ABC-2 family transporter protein [Aquisphaera giovannonii]